MQRNGALEPTGHQRAPNRQGGRHERTKDGRRYDHTDTVTDAASVRDSVADAISMTDAETDAQTPPTGPRPPADVPGLTIHEQGRYHYVEAFPA